MPAGLPAATSVPSSPFLPAPSSRRPLAIGVLLSVLLHLPLLWSPAGLPEPEPMPQELTVALAPRPPAPAPDWLARARRQSQQPRRRSPPPAAPLPPPAEPPPAESPPRPAEPLTPPASGPGSPPLPDAGAPAGPPVAAGAGGAEAGAGTVATAPQDGHPDPTAGSVQGAAAPAPADQGATPPASADAARSERLASLPSAGEVDYRVTKGSGEWKAGRGTLRWRIDGDHYRLDLDARAEGLPGLVYWSGIHWSSEGRIGADRLRPDTFSRDGKGGARFDWVNHILTLLPSGATRPLPDGALDVLSVFFQFALRPPADDTLDFQVTNGDKIDRYAFEMTERVRLQLELGEVDTIHISRLHTLQENGFDIWLAEDRNFLPVQMRLYSVRIGVVNLYATGIRINGLQGRLQEP